MARAATVSALLLGVAGGALGSCDTNARFNINKVVFNDLKVLDNVEIPLLYRRVSSAERRKLALAALDRVGLSSRVHHFPSQLSGGQQQRVSIARAIVGSPKLILADEPTGNLDSRMGEEILQLLRDLNSEEQTTVVMVTHDGRLAEQTQRTIRIFDGRQVQ